jgi:putative protease
MTRFLREGIIPELLAPAGSPEGLKAAIAAGADAVYLGGRRFGARYFASNFDNTLLAESISYAHIRGVKAYVTVNTLIHDDEIPDLIRYLVFLFSIGADAILIQDTGVLSLARDLFISVKTAPSLHASTQMAIHNREGSMYAAERGCTRIVLARELRVQEVRDIAQALCMREAEVEIFAHGALCYAYSGQCLLSAIIGGRSGNRGMCAQPCRKPYDLIRGRMDNYGRLTDGRSVHLKEQYLLSTRDLSIYQVLNMITSLPVAALKIEGRMRSPEYIAIVTGIYRQAIDALRTGKFIPTRQEETDLLLAFSRGFTSGYLNGEDYHSVMGRDLPGRRGILIGIVKGMDQKKRIILQAVGDIIPQQGDGMVCTSSNDEQGFVLHRDPVIRGKVMELELETNIPCRPNDRIFLTSRQRIAKFYKALMQDPDKRYAGSIPLDIRILVDPEGGVGISCDVQTLTGIRIPYSFQSREHLIPAQTQPLTAGRIADAMRKTGGTLFSIRKLEVQCPDGLFAPISVINGIRREILEETKIQIENASLPSPDEMISVSERAEGYLRSFAEKSKKSQVTEKDLHIIVLVSDAVSLQSSLDTGAGRVYMEWYPVSGAQGKRNCSLDTFLEWMEDNPGFQDQVGIKLPKIIRREEMDILYASLPRIIAAGVRYFMVDGVGIAEALASFQGDIQFAGYAGLNITNHLSLISHSRYEFLTLSCELSGSEIVATMRTASRAGLQIPVAVIGQGLLEAMVTEDHLSELAGNTVSDTGILALKDQKGQVFPVIVDPAGRTHIFNAVETTLIDRIPDIRKAGVGIVILDSRWRGEVYAGAVTGIWKRALSVPSSEWTRDIADKVKSEVRVLAHGGLTSGTWKRGLTSE